MQDIQLDMKHDDHFREFASKDADTVSDLDAKCPITGHLDYHGINTTEIQPGADATYERKIALMNEALIDLGMGPYQWKIFACTRFGWFVDNVCTSYPSYFWLVQGMLTCFGVMDASDHDNKTLQSNKSLSSGGLPSSLSASMQD